jgi:hypothetical protein
MISYNLDNIFEKKVEPIPHEQQLAIEFDQYLIDNYIRNVIMFKNTITIMEVREQLFILYQLLNGKRKFNSFDLPNDNNNYDFKFEYLAHLFKNRFDIDIKRKNNEKNNLSKYIPSNF